MQCDTRVHLLLLYWWSWKFFNCRATWTVWKSAVGLSPVMSPVSQSCQGHLNWLSTFLADWMKKIRAERTDKTIPFMPSELFSERLKGCLPAAPGAMLISAPSVMSCWGEGCPLPGQSLQHFLWAPGEISLHSSPVTAAKLVTWLVLPASLSPASGPVLAQSYPTLAMHSLSHHTPLCREGNTTVPVPVWNWD